MNQGVEALAAPTSPAGEPAAPAEPPKNVVVAIDQMEPDLGFEVVGLGRIQSMPPADIVRRGVDDRETREKE